MFRNFSPALLVPHSLPSAIGAVAPSGAAIMAPSPFSLPPTRGGASQRDKITPMKAVEWWASLRPFVKQDIKVRVTVRKVGPGIEPTWGIERGEYNLTIQDALTIAKGSGISLSKLVSGIEEKLGGSSFAAIRGRKTPPIGTRRCS